MRVGRTGLLVQPDRPAVKNIIVAEVPKDLKCETLPGLFTPHDDPVPPLPVGRAECHKVIRSDLVMLRMKEQNARAISQPEGGLIGAFFRDFQAFLPPKVDDPFRIHASAR